VAAIRPDGWTPNKNHKICSKHFKDSDFLEGKTYRVLKKDVIPTIFDFECLAETAVNCTIGVKLSEAERQESPMAADHPVLESSMNVPDHCGPVTPPGESVSTYFTPCYSIFLKK